MFSVLWWGACSVPALVVLEWRTVQLAISAQWRFLSGFSVCLRRKLRLGRARVILEHSAVAPWDITGIRWRLFLIWRWSMVCACIFVVSKDLCGIGILYLGFIHPHRGLSSGPGLTRTLWHHAGVCLVVCGRLGRRGVLVILSEGSTVAAAAADDREDSTCSLAKCHSARMPCFTRLFSLCFREYACLSPRSFYL